MEKDNRDVVYAVVNSFIVDQKEEWLMRFSDGKVMFFNSKEKALAYANELKIQVLDAPKIEEQKLGE